MTISPFVALKILLHALCQLSIMILSLGAVTATSEVIGKAFFIWVFANNSQYCFSFFLPLENHTLVFLEIVLYA